MMGAMTYLIGEVATSRGLIMQRDIAGGAESWELPANSYERVQRRVPVLVDHDPGWEIGEVAYYERSKRGLVAVAHLHSPGPLDDADDRAWYFSPSVTSTRCGPFEWNHGKINELSLVRRTASIATHPCAWSPHSGAPHNMPLPWFETWARAHEAITDDRYRHRRDDALRIVDVDPLSLVDEVLCDGEVAARVAAEAARYAARTRTTRVRAPLPDPSRVYSHALGGSLSPVHD
jgi:hypothetical protein